MSQIELKEHYERRIVYAQEAIKSIQRQTDDRSQWADFEEDIDRFEQYIKNIQ